MVDNMQDDNVFKIPIKINDYTDLFSSLDYRNLCEREINEEVDNFIDTLILKSNKIIKDIKIELIIYMPIDIKDEVRELESKEGLINYYKGYFEYKKKLNFLGIKRVIYYAISALALLIAWYYILKYNGENFITSLLNAGGTVLLWEIMSLVLIERKNAKEKDDINKKISNMNIIFRYLE